MPSHALDVFVNCPFDKEYRELFGSLIFAIHDCGFVPRCVLENSDGGMLRMNKLEILIRDAPRGVHDLTRTELDDVNALPRFNMPLELGLFLGARTFGGKRHQEKRVLILDRESYRYQKFCSDLAGYDPRAHGEEPVRLISAVRTWLRDDPAYTGDTMMPGEERIAERFNEFWSQLPDLCTALSIAADAMPFDRYGDFTRLITTWQKETPL